MKPDIYVIGVDYGSDSVRSVLVNAINGEEIASSVFHYPRWKKGLYCDPAINQFRQHPLDYTEGLEQTIKQCLSKAGDKVDVAAIKAIAVDTTGSTPVAVDATGTPLALLPEFENNPHAMFVLWKDHTATSYASQAFLQVLAGNDHNSLCDPSRSGKLHFPRFVARVDNFYTSFANVGDQICRTRDRATKTAKTTHSS